MRRVCVFIIVAAALVGVQVNAQRTPAAQLPGPPRDGTAVVAQTGTGVLRGRVVDAQTGQPVRQAQISINASGIQARRSTTTDPDGRYEFTQLPAGQYLVSAAKVAFVTAQFGQRRPDVAGTRVDVQDDRIVGGIDIALPRGGVIAGQITDQFGDAVAGVQVQAERLQYGPDGVRRPGVAGIGAVADDLGQFRVYGLSEGEYLLSAGTNRFPATAPAPGGPGLDVTEGYAPTYYPGTVNPNVAQPLTVRAGAETTAQFSLVTTRLTTVSGTVMDSGGRPAAGMTLSLSVTRANGGANRFAGQVEADGSFTIQNVAPGEYSVDVRPLPRPGAALAFGSAAIEVGTTPVTGVNIVTTTGTTISGEVVFEGTSPRPPGPMRVIPSAATTGGFALIRNEPNSGIVGDDGRFEIAGVIGRAMFQASAAGWVTKAVVLDGRDITEIPVDLTGREALPDLRIVMTDRLTGISGQVSDSRGQLLKEYIVVLQRTDAPPEIAAPRFVRAIRPGGDGRFQVRGMRPGRYVATAVEWLETGREYAPEFQQQLRRGAPEFTLREGESVTLDLRLTPD